MQQILRSTEDRSINFVTPAVDGGKIEARFVQRLDDTIIVYLSSMTGCNLACRFCHLTQTRQTTMTPVTVEGYLSQAQDVLSLAALEGRLNGVSIVHFNFMARGDALSNIYFLRQTELLFYRLNVLAKIYKLEAKFKISSIFPVSLFESYKVTELKDWVDSVCSLPYDVEFYYSLYSLDPGFRKRWIPKGLDPDVVGSLFRGYDHSFRLHYALIDKANCSIAETNAVKNWLTKHNIQCRLNIVRYNPYSEACGQEPSFGDMNTYKEFMKLSSNIIDVHVISRVGSDVAASCGTFIE